MELFAILAGVAVTLLAARVLFRLFFSDNDDFWECVRFTFTPDIISLFRGEYFQDVTKSFKLSAWIIASVGSGILTGLFIRHVFGG